MLLLGFGVAALLRESGAWHVKWEAIISGLLMVLGVGLVFTARSGGRVWLPIVLGGVLVLALSAHSPSLHFDLPASSAIGDRTIRVDSATTLRPSYNHGLGDLTLDLTRMPLDPEATKELSVNLGLGNVKILLPEGADVKLEANLGIGKALVPDRGPAQGIGVQARYRTPHASPASPRLSIKVHVGIGQVEVLVIHAGP
jgi:hypothetical protein